MRATLRHPGRRFWLALVLVTAVIAGLLGSRPLRAQAPSASFAYAVYLRGWNLVSPGVR